MITQQLSIRKASCFSMRHWVPQVSQARCMIQSIFAAASGCIRIRNPYGTEELSEPFNISRGVLQGDIFSPVAFIVGLWRTFALHDTPGAGVTVGEQPHQVTVSSLEYADDAGLIDENATNASTRITSIAVGSRNDAAMEISKPKMKALHIHWRNPVSKTTEQEIVALKLKHKCPVCELTSRRSVASPFTAPAGAQAVK